MKLPRILPTVALLTAALAPVPATADEDFTAMTLEELAQIQVTSIARKHGSLFDTPAAAFVLTGEDLHRAGVTNLASALRAVPGMQVGQIDALDYAISARGFNDATSSKLLVLMDGRSLYSQTFSGAYWNFHELFLEDIDRLETIRGPGAALWGANAMNGVVNIVSKSAFATPGTLVTTAHGDRLDVLTGVRHGWQINAAMAARVYARYQEDFDHGNAGPLAGWNNLLAGTRVDWRRPQGGTVTLISEFRDQEKNTTAILPLLTPPYGEVRPDRRRRSGGHVLLRWRQPVGESAELVLQGSYERSRFKDATLTERHHILDSDLQLSLRPWRRHELLAGFSARRDADRLSTSGATAYSIPSATTSFLGGFLQDEITLLPRRLAVTIGAKMERNSFTGWELQPNIRALWIPHPAHRLWAAASRAARTPSRAERAIDWFATVIPPNPLVPIPTAVHARGDADFDSEHVNTVEVGHRFRALRQLTFDTALFVSSYRDVRGLQQDLVPFVPQPVPHARVSYSAVNNVEGLTYGGELLTRWRPNEFFYLEASVAALRYDLQAQLNQGTEIAIPALVGSSPRQDYKLRANWDFAEDWSFDLLAWRTDAMPYHGLPSYLGLDLHLAWRLRHDLELELVTRNSLDSRHGEAPNLFFGGTVREIPRSYFVRVTFRR